MNDTFSIFEDRKNEIEFYFSVMIEIDRESDNIRTIDNSRFFKISKSNFILMLYNLVEACTVNGMLEIYRNLKDDNCTYNNVIDEIKKIWSKYKISQVYGPMTAKETYQNTVEKIINDITTDNPIELELNKNTWGIAGNLDARKIKSICDKHRIRYRLQCDGASLKQVKDKRNSLAHGYMSFSNCARDLTIDELGNIKNEVFTFLEAILEGMRQYYDDKLYMDQRQSSNR